MVSCHGLLSLMRVCESTYSSARHIDNLCVLVCVAIAASQCVLFLLESAQEASRARSSHMDDAALEAQRLYNNKEYTSTPLPSDNADRPADILSRSLLETLRLTAHSIGAIRKVVSPQGWKVSVEGSCSSGDAHCGTQHTSQDYVVPCGSYVGASHIVPHRDETM